MMYIETLMEKKHMTRSELSQRSSVPESTLRDILSGKANLEHCEALTMALIASALDTTVENILMHYWQEQRTVGKPEKKPLTEAPLVVVGDSSVVKLLERIMSVLWEDDASCDR